MKMKSNLLLHAIFVPIYWTLTYFNPLVLAFFTSIVATLTFIAYLVLHFRSKRQEQEELAHILYRLDKILK